MKFDELLVQIGEFGPYQKRVYCLVSLTAVVSAFATMSPVFLLHIPNYRCALPSYKNDTYAIHSDYHGRLVNLSVPMVTDTQGETTQSKCNLYNVTDQYGDNATEYACTSWVYDTSIVKSSGITDFDMVCGDEIYRSHSNMISFAGGFPAGFVMGPLADAFGRKKVLLLSILLTVAASVASALSTSYIMYVVVGFIYNFSSLSLFMVPFVIGVELVGPSKRTLAGFVIEFFWVGGLFLLTMAAYFVRNWRHLRFVIGVPPIILLSYWWIIPESPRWLISKGRYDEAYTILKKIAESNKTELDAKIMKNVETDDEIKTVRFWKMFTTPVLLIRTLVIFFNWCSIALVYYGLSLNVGNLSGDTYLNFFISSVMELVAYLGSLILLHRVGRKRLLLSSQLLGGVACLATIFPVVFGDSSTEWILVALSMLGKLGSAAAYAIIYFYATELFPTVTRQTGISACTITGMVGGMVSPYIADLGLLVKGPLAAALPLIVFGSVTICAGLLLLVLPETRGKVLPETIEDAIVFGKEDEAPAKPSSGVYVVPKEDQVTRF